MAFLYENLNWDRQCGRMGEIPSYIQNNLNPAFPLRPYQIEAFENFIAYFENDRLCRKPTQTLFHMATGSGKTMIMAGLMLYLYKKGYRNFLFFVNLDNIIVKTKENFLKARSSKFLFSGEMKIEGEKVPIKEVPNFQSSDENAINLCFTTTQSLHFNLWSAKENTISVDDFSDKKVVLISDEAHHLNVDTKTLEKDREEAESYHSWEQTVRRIFEANRENVLLEFTATCDLANPRIKAEYESKIVYNYPLSEFRKDGYSKEIRALRTDVSIMERALQAIMLSQYRLKIFQDYRLDIKPVILFKAHQIAESTDFMERFIDTVQALTGDELRRISTLTDNETLQKAYTYFGKNGVTFEQLAQELKEDFSRQHCISANDDKEAEARQLALNSLEDPDNPYRAVFAVDKLNEGWDVLNLFDIVRLYETRQSGGKKLSPTTMKEAQLIGRGARYCPFTVNDEQERYKRKYDKDSDHPLRICEELYYHCQNEPRYISELTAALREIGIDLDKVAICHYVLKDSFKSDSLYRDGFVFVNDRMPTGRENIVGLPLHFYEQPFSVAIATGSSGEDILLGAQGLNEKIVPTQIYRRKVSEIADLNYSIVHKALCQYENLKFNILKGYFPNLRSTREFISAPNYLGGITLEISSAYETPPPSVLFFACEKLLGAVSENIATIEETFMGTKEFRAERICDVFTDKRCNYTIVHDDSVGQPQSNRSDAHWVDLPHEDWFAYEDNYGTSEEKAFVRYFQSHVSTLKAKYDKVYLVRNERQLHIYSFDKGARFEPDYLLFLQTKTEKGYEQIQVFIEPKGEGFAFKDQWKEDFLLQIEANAVSVKINADDNDYKICGFHFYTDDKRAMEFSEDMAKLL